MGAVSSITFVRQSSSFVEKEYLHGGDGNARASEMIFKLKYRNPLGNPALANHPPPLAKPSGSSSCRLIALNFVEY